MAAWLRSRIRGRERLPDYGSDADGSEGGDELRVVVGSTEIIDDSGSDEHLSSITTTTTTDPDDDQSAYLVSSATTTTTIANAGRSGPEASPQTMPTAESRRTLWRGRRRARVSKPSSMLPDEHSAQPSGAKLAAVAATPSGSPESARSKPLDPPPTPGTGDAIWTRWTRGRARIPLSIIADRACARKGTAVVDRLSSVFLPGKLSIVFAPHVELCELVFGLLSGGTPVTEGSCLGNGIPLTHAPARRRLGAVRECGMALPDATVEENVALAVVMRLPPAACGTTPETIQDIVADVLALLGLYTFRQHRVGALARLPRFLVALGMELVAGPAALVVDDLAAAWTGHEHAEVAAVLARIASVLEIPVMAVTTDVPFAFASLCGGSFTVLGCGGQLFYAGRAADAGRFFTQRTSLWTAPPQAMPRPRDPGHRRTGSSRTPTPPSRSSSPSAPRRGSALLPREGRTDRKEGQSASNAPFVFVLVADVVAAADGLGTTKSLASAFDRHADGQRLRALLMEETRAAARLPDFTSPEAALRSSPAWSVEVAARPADLRCRGSVAFLKHLRLRVVALLQYGVVSQWRRLDQVVTWCGLFLTIVLCTLLAERQGSDASGMMNKRGVIFFLLSVAMQANSLFVDSDVSHRHAMAHLRRRELYSAWCCWAATLLRLALPRVGMAAAAFVAAEAWLRSDATGLAALVCLTSTAHSLAIAVWLEWLPSVRANALVQAGYVLFATLCSGFIVAASSIPPFIGSLSLLRPGYGGAVANIMRGKPLACDAAANGTVGYCFTGDEYLTSAGLQNDSVGGAAVQLVFISVAVAVLLLASYYVSWR